MKKITNRIINRLKREAFVHGLNTSVITALVEDFIAKRYPDIGEYKFFERDIPTHLKGPTRYSDAGILGYFSVKDKDDNEKIKLCQIELNQYYLTLDGKNFISEHNLPELKGFYFTVIIGIELDDNFNPIYSEELFHTLVIDYARTVIAKIKNDANENRKTSKYLDNSICVSSITEPQLLYQIIKANKVNKSDTE